MAVSARRVAVITVPGGRGKSFGNCGGGVIAGPACAHGGKVGAAAGVGVGVTSPACPRLIDIAMASARRAKTIRTRAIKFIIGQALRLPKGKTKKTRGGRCAADRSLGTQTCRAFGAACLDLRLRSSSASYFTVTWMLLVLLVSLLSATTFVSSALAVMVWVPFTLPVFQSKVAVTEKPLLTGGVST
jgi:hypothetical protein